MLDREQDPTSIPALAQPRTGGPGSRCPGLGNHAPCARRGERYSLTALGGLLIPGWPPRFHRRPRAERLAGHLGAIQLPSTGAKINASFNRVASGDCLMWPDGAPESAANRQLLPTSTGSIASPMTCGHSRHGVRAKRCSVAPPAFSRSARGAVRRAAVRREVPLVRSIQPGKFYHQRTAGPATGAWRQAGGAACSVALPSPVEQPAALQGARSRHDQSRSGRPVPAWASMPPPTSRSTFVPVDCAAPHAVGIRHGQPGGGFPTRAERTRAGPRFHQDACADDGRHLRTPQSCVPPP